VTYKNITIHATISDKVIQGIIREFCATSGKIVTNKVFLVRHSNICVKQLLTG